jgi:hypothetical protein
MLANRENRPVVDKIKYGSAQSLKWRQSSTAIETYNSEEMIVFSLYPCKKALK